MLGVPNHVRAERFPCRVLSMASGLVPIRSKLMGGITSLLNRDGNEPLRTAVYCSLLCAGSLSPLWHDCM